jgi:citrate synthase
MMEGKRQVLLELTTEHLESGLRGIPVGYCTTSSVDAQTGLCYVEKPVEELAERDPEDVIYLLYNKRWPDASQKMRFASLLRQRRAVDPQVFETMKSLPHSGHPMKWLVHGLNVMGMVHGTGDYREDCLNVIAKIPVLVAALFRIRSGWGEPIAPHEDLGYMENFVHMLGIPGLDAEHEAKLARLMRVFDVLHFDHGGGNLSTFTGKVVASGHADLYESLGAAMAALAGPLHGKANQECLEFVQECVRKIGSEPTADKVRDLINQKLAHKEVIYGFGHAVLRNEDPRARALRKLGEELCPDALLFRMVKLLTEVVPPILKQNPKISNPYPNVDSASGSLLMSCGLNDPSYYTVLFGLSRCVGIAIQIVYERCEARGGKGTPIIRPSYYYSPEGTAKGEAVIKASG